MRKSGSSLKTTQITISKTSLVTNMARPSLQQQYISTVITLAKLNQIFLKSFLYDLMLRVTSNHIIIMLSPPYICHFRTQCKNDFSGVTLVCDDGQQVEAHQIILAPSSLLLGRNKHPQPLIYMRGIQSHIFWLVTFRESVQCYDFAHYFLHVQDSVAPLYNLCIQY